MAEPNGNMPEPKVLYEVRDGIGTITLNRPAVLNAIDFEVIEQLGDAAERASADDGVWVVVLRGAGRAFCSGMDRTALARGGITPDFYRGVARATNALEDMPKLSIAVLHSWSIGGGLQFASACDLRIATDDAVLEFGATRHGLVPDATILRIARLIGLSRAKYLALLNERVSAEDAPAWGLVNWVVPAAELERTVADVVDRAFHASRTAVAESKRLLHESFHRDPREMVDELVQAEARCHASWELEAANAAWREKRAQVRFYPRAT
jgi:enoyl-CoA hydratase/carnithine racemase